MDKSDWQEVAENTYHRVMTGHAQIRELKKALAEALDISEKRREVESLKANLYRTNARIAKAMGYLNPVTGGDIDGIVGRAKAARAEVGAAKARAGKAEAEVERWRQKYTLRRKGYSEEIDRMRPVVEAADKWRDGQYADAAMLLIRAVDTYRASPRREPPTPPAEALRQALVDEPPPTGLDSEANRMALDSTPPPPDGAPERVEADHG